MIESIEFSNYKALRNTTLPLAPFTLLLGPNGSGKTSILQAIQGISTIFGQYKDLLKDNDSEDISGPHWWAAPNVTAVESPVRITLHIKEKDFSNTLNLQWVEKRNVLYAKLLAAIPRPQKASLRESLQSMRVYSFDAIAIAQPAQVTSEPLRSNGTGLPAVLDDLKDNYPERWSSLLEEMREWLPEYDHIQFVKPENGRKALALRTKRGGHMIPANQLSQGTLVAPALLTLAYQPNPPSLIGLEEIDRGLHPRLLRHLQDALYRLSYPESCGEKRPPIQVIATTHSPYLLDLYRDHPEEVVIAQKEGLEVTFKRLSEIEHFQEILGDAPLSEVWYSGVLGGVTVKP